MAGDNQQALLTWVDHEKVVSGVESVSGVMYAEFIVVCNCCLVLLQVLRVICINSVIIWSLLSRLL